MSVPAGRTLGSPRTSGVRVVGFVVGVGIAAAVALLALWLTRSSPALEPAADDSPKPVLSVAAFEAATGVRVAQVAVTGGGGLIDLRYQVLDPDKANAVHGPEDPPLVIDEATGVPISHLVMNHAPHGATKAGVTYYLIFYNSGDVVQRGGKVTVQLGDARLAHVLVR